VRFHPSLTLQGGYDTNIFYEDTNEQIDGAPVVGVRPELEIGTHKATNVDFQLKVGGFYQYFVSSNRLVAEQSGFAVDGGTALTFNPNGAVAFKLSDTFLRTNETPSGSSLTSFNRIYNDAAVDLIIQPGGKVLTLALGGHAALTRHQVLQDLDKTEFGARAALKWKFLPKTALVVDASWDFIYYDTAERTIPGLAAGDERPFLAPFQGGLTNVNSQPLRVRGGLKGLLFSRISLTILGGYGQGFYESGSDFTGFIGSGEIAYEIGPTSRFRVGYERTFRDNSFSSFATDHKAYMGYNHQFGGRFDLVLDGSFIHREFSETPTIFLPDVNVSGVQGTSAYSTTRRVDPLINGGVDGTFYITRIFTVGMSYDLSVNTSNFVQITGVGSVPGNPVASGSATTQFVKHRAFLNTGVRW
jgi:hypothetical protein